MNNPYREQFIQASEDWVCESSSVDIRYIAIKNEGKIFLLAASIGVAPLPPTVDMSFCLESGLLFSGHIQKSAQTKKKVLEILADASHGKIEANGLMLELNNEEGLGYHSELNWGDKWFYELKLQVIGNRRNGISFQHIDACKIDDELRQASPPFDGLADLSNWLVLKNPLEAHESPSIHIGVLPPVDYDFQSSKLERNVLTLNFLAHQNFDWSRLTVAVRAVPGNGIQSRKQIASEIKWKINRKGVREGRARIRLHKADSALTMFVIGNLTVRRQWFLDAAKSSNNRLAAVNLFDKELKQVRNALFETADSGRFEMGVALLFFLMGFSPAVQIETNSPDVVVATPSGRIILLECTLRIADFSTKLGKLVDRKRSLEKFLADSTNPTQVEGILVCGAARDQIAVKPEDLQSHQIALISRDELFSALDKVRFHIDPDKYVDEIISRARQPANLSNLFSSPLN